MVITPRHQVQQSSGEGGASVQPVSALLSQLLVAFTIELDNEFERRMREAGYAGACLSLVLWLNLMRFVSAAGESVRDLAAHAVVPDKRIKFELGCLERWGLVVLKPSAGDDRPIPAAAHRQTGRVLRDGWGSGRGIPADWVVRLTPKAVKAVEIWPPLLEEIERRWQARFGNDEMKRLRESLQSVVVKLDRELPQGFPGEWPITVPDLRRAHPETEALPLPTLLSQALLAFTLEFDRESRAPLALCANALRVLGREPTREGEIPRLTGGSPETSGIGWQLKPYIIVKPDASGKRGKVVQLSPLGLGAQQTYFRLTREIEKRWEERFGKKEICCLRESLQGIFARHDESGPALAAGLRPPGGVVRAGERTPALGRRDVGAAARKRMRDLVAQSQSFVSDPAGTLPHYPLWDMNRGFGP
jgi:DNA-binding MarR family transcriptional regulator